MTPASPLVDAIRAELRAAAKRRDLTYPEVAWRTGYSTRSVRRTLDGTAWSLDVVRELDRVLRPRLAPDVRAQLDGALRMVPVRTKHLRSPLEAITPDPELHPLAELLGPVWRWVERRSPPSVLVLHEVRGTWFEFPAAELWRLADDRSVDWAPIAARIEGHATRGDIGRHELQLPEPLARAA